MRAVVIGSGIGGLLTASFLAKNGYEVTLLEKAPYIGGRCTNLNYKGFGLSTGAFHMIPHGEDGPLAHLLKLLGADVQIVNSNPKGMIFYEGRTFSYRDGWKYLNLTEKAKATKLLLDIKRGKLPHREEAEMSGREWIRERVGDNEFVDLFIKSFLGWADSVLDVPAIELAKEIKAALRWGGPGLVKGGCKSIPEALSAIIRMNGGRILTKKKAIEVDHEAKKVITADNEELTYDVLISNVGIKETVSLIGRDAFDKDYLKRVDSLKPSEGIKYNVALKGETRIGNTVVFTLDTERINGYNEPSSINPELAKEGYTLIMLHHALQSRNVKAEQKKGIEDIHRIFPNLDKEGEILLVQTYLGGNPVNRVASGQLVEDFPIRDIYVVGDAYKMPGGIEVDGIALGVMRTLEKLGLESFSEWYL
ncbi:NAD(P)/FAD-dependent oxidoreductase [Thermococcus sp. GR7]|uniref:phytoene desaturase family protein n=1 Tax=unclassified Thermococcus TaxID=2627626 RepID=UPI00142FA42C|nr:MULTISPECIES: NAD(P)/FAD-dependent oxidoreductase [unclassified Thermococcus]NJE46670.1 NAD(P)/FAD-dependent oxidoreductase [Thermococcus sp. GR7]NJE77902.1 NAD(P)/FAD-dependent oxidoreductase [Thermococcus sp. GR4]NJF23030.1 NAD(P)/FAD-dependent oxidoreductase [Thermococcus sp. GR5]